MARMRKGELQGALSWRGLWLMLQQQKPAKKQIASGSAIHDRCRLPNQQRLADAMVLTERGVELRGAKLLTECQVSFLSAMFSRYGMKAISGRCKTCQGLFVR